MSDVVEKRQPQKVEATETVRLVSRKEGEQWVVICLEYFLAAQGESEEQARNAMAQTFVTEFMIARKKKTLPFISIKETPANYLLMWEKGPKARTCYMTISLPTKSKFKVEYKARDD